GVVDAIGLTSCAKPHVIPAIDPSDARLADRIFAIRPEIDGDLVLAIPMNAVVGDRVLDEMPHVLFLRAPRDVGTIPHAKSPLVERHPGIGDGVGIDLIEPDDRETRMALEGLTRAVADRKPNGILPRHPHSEMPAHVIE